MEMEISVSIFRRKEVKAIFFLDLKSKEVIVFSNKVYNKRYFHFLFEKLKVREVNSVSRSDWQYQEYKERWRY